MKKFLALSLALVMLLSLFAGCSKTEKPAEDNKDNTNADANKPADTQEKKRTDIVFGESVDIVTLDPSDSVDLFSAKAIFMIFDTLIDMDAESNYIPGLAESWDEVSDTELVFHLRKGVKFHNGEEMKASDVKFSLDRVQANPKSKNMLAQVSAIDVVDEYTISLKLSAPYAPILLNLTEAACSILNEKAVTEAGEEVNKKPVGTGPMKFEEWKVNDELKLVRFDEHWGGTPVTTSIRMRVIPENSARTIALENGEVDMVGTLPAVDIARVKENDKLVLDERDGSAIIQLGINTQKEPLNNKDVRKALHYAINKQAIIDVVAEGHAVAATSPFSTVNPNFNAEIKDMYAYDAEKAKALLTQAGFPDGFTTSVYVSSDDRNRAAQLIQSDLAKIGVTMEIEMMELATLMEYCNAGKHDMFILGWGVPVNSDRTMSSNFHSSMVGASGNRSFYTNPALDTIIEQARGEMDTAKRDALYKEAQKIVMDDLPWIPLWQPNSVGAYNKNLQGVEWYKRGGGNYTNAYVVEQ